MAISKSQGIAMAVIVLVGLAGGGAVLLTDRAGGDGSGGSEATQHSTDAHSEKTTPAGQSSGAPASTGQHGQPHEPHEPNTEAADSHGHEEPAQSEAGHVTLSDAQIAAAAITLQTAGPAKLQAVAQFQGEIRFDEDRTAHIVPRLAGVAESVSANLGQTVQKGQVVAVIASPALADQRSELLTAQKRRDLAKTTFEREKKLWQDKISAEQDYLQAQSALQEADIAVQNASQKLAAVGAGGASKGALNRFEIRAPFTGTITEKHLSLGEAVKEDATIFTLSDLSLVWAEFAVAPKDLGMVRVGQKVVVSSTAFDSKVEGAISYVGALIGEQTRTARARVTLVNPKGAWRPGLFVTVAVLGDLQEVPLAVAAEALQTIDGKPVLFVRTPGGFMAQPVMVGRDDGRMVEILGGLQPGDVVAATNSFVLKSELGKATAEHSH